MQNNKDIQKTIGVLVATVAATDGAPAGHLYAGMMNNVSLEEFQTAIAVAQRAGWLEVDGMHWVNATPSGMALAAKVDAAIEAVRNERRPQMCSICRREHGREIEHACE